jgi:hypothetical protein
MGSPEREDLIPRYQTPEQWEAEQTVLRRAACLLQLDSQRYGAGADAGVRILVARQLMDLALALEVAKLSSEAWLSELTGENKWPEDVRPPQALSWEDGR